MYETWKFSAILSDAQAWFWFFHGSLREMLYLKVSCVFGIIFSRSYPILHCANQIDQFIRDDVLKDSGLLYLQFHYTRHTPDQSTTEWDATNVTADNQLRFLTTSYASNTQYLALSSRPFIPNTLAQSPCQHWRELWRLSLNLATVGDAPEISNAETIGN